MGIGTNKDGSAPITVTREVQRITFGANTLKTQELPKSVHAELHLQLLINSTPDAALTEDTDVSAESVLKIVQNMRLVHNGSDVQIQAPLWPFYFMNRYDLQINPPKSFSLASGVAADNKITVKIPFMLTRAMSPEDTLLDLRGIDKSVIEFNFLNEIRKATTHADVINSGHVRIFTKEFTNIDAVPRARHDYSFTSSTLPLTGDNQINLPVRGNNQYKRIFLFFRDTNGALSDSQCNTVELSSGTFSWIKKDYSLIQHDNVCNYGITATAGCIILDTTAFGQMSRRLDARNLSELILKLNTPNGTGSVDIFMEKAIYA